MKVDGRHFRTIWRGDGDGFEIIDQTRLPHEFSTLRIGSVEDAATAIRTMQVRGAPLIGATGAFGIATGMASDPSDSSLSSAYAQLLATRPTAINLGWALRRMMARLRDLPSSERAAAAWREAQAIADEDVRLCEAIGNHGFELFQQRLARRRRSGPLNVLTHCNAGWLATVDWGTALAPIYKAFDAGIDIHVWVDETRPRNQGASLTAWELASHGVPHTIIADNAGGLLMMRGEVDLCIVGSDRTTAAGDVANKIGTYLKALAAKDNDVPFYVALPYSTIDWRLSSGRDIPIEDRGADEVTSIQGAGPDGAVVKVRLAPASSGASNPAFDITPARLVTALITERGVTPASQEGLAALYPEFSKGGRQTAG